MKTLQVIPHLSLEELSKKLSSSTKAHHRSYWQLLLSVMINPNKSAEEYSAFLGIKPSKICHIVKRYNKEGADTFEKKQWGGRRKGVELLTLEEEIAMMASLKEQALQGHILTMHDIREKVEARVNQSVSDDYLWDLFKRHDWKKKRPRPEHPKTDLEKQEDFKKNSLNCWQPLPIIKTNAP